MMTLCVGSALERSVRTLEADPSRYAEVVICAPFIDRQTMARLVTFAIEARKCGCGVRLITSDKNCQLLTGWPRQDQVGTRTVIKVARLHAKVYLALGRVRADSWAIVTSANLTAAGLRKNFELGLLILATSPEGAQMVEYIRSRLERLTTLTKEK